MLCNNTGKGFLSFLISSSRIILSYRVSIDHLPFFLTLSLNVNFTIFHLSPIYVPIHPHKKKKILYKIAPPPTPILHMTRLASKATLPLFHKRASHLKTPVPLLLPRGGKAGRQKSNQSVLIPGIFKQYCSLHTHNHNFSWWWCYKT